MNGAITFRLDGPWLVGTAELTTADGQTRRFEGRANLPQIQAIVSPLICRKCAPALASAGAYGAFGDAFVGASLKEKRDRLKAKARRQGGRLSAEDARELARLRAKIAKGSGGIFGKIAHAVTSTVNKVAKAKILRDIARTAKGALKLPGVSQAISAAAVAFPPLGVPAMVAFKVANTAIAAAERGGPQAAQFARQVGMLKHVARRRDAAGLKARKALKVLHITHQWRRGLHAAQRQATQQAVRGLELPEAPIPDPMFMLSGNPPLFLSQGDPLFGRPY